MSVSEPADASPVDRLHGLIAEYGRFSLARDPVTAGQRGDLASLGRWPDETPAADKAALRTILDFQARLDAIPAAGLPTEEALDRGFLARLLNTERDALRLDEARLPFNADDGFYNLPDYTARGTVIRSRDEAEAWLTRLAAIPAYYATAMDNAKRGLDTGFSQPAIVVEAALRSVRAQAAVPVEESAFLLPFASPISGIPEADRSVFQARAREIVSHDIKPAQAALVAFLTETYLPRARTKVGIGSVPGGPAYYAFAVRRHTTTDLTPDQVHEIGVKEVARIRAAMDGVMAETGFKGSFPEFLAYLRTDSQFYVTSRPALLEKASEVAKRIDGELPKWFGLLPRLTYGVKPVPPEIEESYTSARYWPGSPDSGVAGGYMVNTSHLDQRPLYELPALTLHEAVPGHHLQIALAQENRSIPQYRADADLTAYIEGWAVYAETLGLEMGIYRDPYERFGQLSMEMWRACRLVVDTGIHAQGWSRDRAIAYLSANTALSEKNIAVEVDRYIGWPGQALGYKIGQIKIRDLRARAEAKLGQRFDIRRFHDLILGDGPLPLDLLEHRVDDWIATQ